jgi:hypothetical protein
MKGKRNQPMGAKAVRGSDAARRLAALLLEAWSGVRSTQDASLAMGVALTRFYQLEARALESIVAAMEPRPRGRQVTAAGELEKLRQANQKLKRDAERFAALYRTSQRALGVTIAKVQAPAKNAAPGGTRRRGPRKKARGQAVAAVLLGDAPAIGANEADDGTTDQGSGARRRVGGRSGEQEPAQGDPARDSGPAVGERRV